MTVYRVATKSIIQPLSIPQSKEWKIHSEIVPALATVSRRSEAETGRSEAETGRSEAETGRRVRLRLGGARLRLGGVRLILGGGG